MTLMTLTAVCVSVQIILLFFFTRRYFLDRAKPKPDVYLPWYLFWFGFLLTLGAAIGEYFALTGRQWIGLGIASGIELIGIGAMLCQLNQRISYSSPSTFTYTTFLGRASEHYFYDITKVRRNGDSVTVFIGKKKLHIESMARGGSAFVYDAVKYSSSQRLNSACLKPGIRRSLAMIKGGTSLFILNLIIPISLTGIGVLGLFSTPPPKIINMKTIEVCYEDIDVEHNSRSADSYILICAEGVRYNIDNIYSYAFKYEEFSQIPRGQQIYVSLDTAQKPSGDSVQPIYSVYTDNAVYLSSEDAIEAIQKNADLGKILFIVFLVISSLYLLLFLYAMSDAEKHYKLLKLFISSGNISLPNNCRANKKSR